jgi:hypothetical protein
VEVSAMIAGIDAQIRKLQEARAALESVSSPDAATKGTRGRPKGSKTAVVKVAAPAKSSKRKLSPEGRKRIADAMKRRWAERRKTTAKPAATKATAVKAAAVKTAAK